MMQQAHPCTYILLLSHFSRVRLCATPIDGSPPGSPVPGILQARTLEWVAISLYILQTYNSKRYMRPNAHSTSVHNSQDMSTNR